MFAQMEAHQMCSASRQSPCTMKLIVPECTSTETFCISAGLVVQVFSAATYLLACSARKPCSLGTEHYFQKSVLAGGSANQGCRQGRLEEEGQAHQGRQHLPSQGVLQPLRPLRHILCCTCQGCMRLPWRRCEPLLLAVCAAVSPGFKYAGILG